MNRLLITATLAAWAVSAAEDIAAQARGWATSGRRPEAIELLERRLAEQPGDSDARVMYGIILSWEGRHLEAREQLSRVLAESPDHGDAAPALARVEMWSGHPERAVAMLRGRVSRHPHDQESRLLLVRALSAASQRELALVEIKSLLALAPAHEEALRLRRRILEEGRHWETQYGETTEWFNDGRSAWRERQASLKRGTARGPVIARFSHAGRFGISSRFAELDAYPRIREGTYFYLNGGASPDGALYPRYRLGAELYQSLGRGFEASGGFRGLGFGERVTIYTGSLTRYYGDWMFTGRTYVTPGAAGASRSLQFQTRRYSGDGESYWALRGGWGGAPVETRSVQEFEILHSASAAAEINWRVKRRWVIQAGGGFSQEDRLNRTGLWRTFLATSVSFRF